MLPTKAGRHVRAWWDSLCLEMPAALPPGGVGDWQATYKRALSRMRRDCAPGDHEQRAAAEANAGQTSLRAALRVAAAGIGFYGAGYSHGADDDVLCRHADQLAQFFERRLSKVRRTGDMETLLRALADADHLATIHGVDTARSSEKDRDGVPWRMGALSRYACARWWRRGLRRAQREVIEREKIGAGLVGRGKQVYCSDVQVKLRGAQLHRNREMLEAVKALNDEGDEYTLAALAAVSTSNPKLRRTELMVRIRGFEVYARGAGHVAYFATMTCPSRMHPVSERYDGTSPRDAARHLSAVWSRVRSCLARYGVKVYGFRVAEAHKDGCPHWHFVLFFKSHGDAERFRFALLWYALGQYDDGKGCDGDEEGATEHRVDFGPINESATGYLAKYISKGIDGWHEGGTGDLFNGFGEGVGFAVVQHDPNYRDPNTKEVVGRMEVLGRSVDLAQRAQAWSTCHRVRQFQQIGGPPVTLWRELRRIDGKLADWDDGASGPVTWLPQHFARLREEVGAPEALRASADLSSWGAFCRVWADWHGRAGRGSVPNVPRAEWRVRPAYWCADRRAGNAVVPKASTAYGDRRAGQVVGLNFRGRLLATRVREWTVSPSTRQFERLVSDALVMADAGVGGRALDSLGRLRVDSPRQYRAAVDALRQAAPAARRAVALAGGEAARSRRTVYNCTWSDALAARGFGPLSAPSWSPGPPGPVNWAG